MRLHYHTVSLGLIVAAVLLLAFRCPPPPPQDLNPIIDGSAESGYACLWFAADKDATIVCTGGPPGCYDGDVNLGLNFSLEVAALPDTNGSKRSYVHFYMPILPDGTEIIGAWLNFYENSRYNPGNMPIPVVPVVDDWNPRTITANNQPNAWGPQGYGLQIGQFTTYNVWRYGGDVTNEVITYFNDPNSNYGFMLNDQAILGMFRTFTSLNNPSRTLTDPDNSPRLLLRVYSEVPLNSTTITMPPLPDDTDLNEFLTSNLANWPDIVMVKIAPGQNWPADWEVSFQ